MLFRSFIAGLCIAFGAIGYFKIASYAIDPGIGIFLASAIFPAGIIAILLLGAELFTSDCMMIMGVYNKQYSIWQTFRVLIIVLLSNLLGMIFMSGLTSLSGIFSGPITEKIIHVAEIKTTMPISELIFSAILCNIIVCAAVWIAYSVKGTLAKIAILWFMVTIFALSGTEHIVANMYYLITAYFLGADITIGGMAYNFLYVTDRKSVV